MTVLYEGYNDLSKYTTERYSASQWYKPTMKQATSGYEYTYASTLVAYLEGAGYTYDATSNTLSATLSGWKFHTPFKVLVKTSDTSVKGNADGYALNVSYTDGTATKYPSCKGAIVVRSNAYEMIADGSSNYVGLQLGVEEADGIAFYYSGLGTLSTPTDIKFTLLKLGSYPGDETKSSYTATGKTFTSDNTKCQGVSIDLGKFTTE